MTRKSNLVGQTFGRLTVAEEYGRDKRGNVLWRCPCSCGGEAVTFSYKLRSGHTQSCGCMNRERVAGMNRTHGQSGTRLYTIWRNMITRCTDPTNKDYPSYGGRGITVCLEWRESFDAFFRDMGPTYANSLSIDRIANDGNYEPSNCRWATSAQQNRNRRNSTLLTFRGQSRPLPEWCETLGLSRATVRGRLRAGWPTERALTTGADADALASVPGRQEQS